MPTSKKWAEEKGMTVFLYAKIEDGPGTRLERVIETFVPEENLEIYRTLDDLSHRLRQPGDNIAISVLLTASHEDLLDLLLIRDLLADVRIIIVLPDSEDKTIAKGHSLRPRFISYADSDFMDVGAVLSKMFESAPL